MSEHYSNVDDYQMEGDFFGVGGEAPLTCYQCGSNNLRELNTLLVCRDCGAE